MRLLVNGKPLEAPEPCSVGELLRRLEISGHFAVEVNEEIVARSTHARHQLKAGDRVEIVHAIGGG